MINIEALDKIIAVVVVILALSLFVQSLQGLIKKLFKIKSLQIETSLVHLFHYMLNKDVSGIISSKINNSPVLRMILPKTRHPSTYDADIKALYDSVTDEFRKVGRVTTTGKMMLDSISKDDLKKFIGRIQTSDIIDKLVPGSTQKLATVQNEITSLDTTIKKIKSDYAAILSGANVQLTEIEQSIAPLIENARKIFTGETVKADTVITDIAKLGEIKPDTVRAVQDQVKQAIAKLGSDEAAKPAVAALQAVNGALDNLMTVAAGFGSIKTLVGKIETWYDTVMQSFEERYARSMRTATWILSALVVIFLNANLITIYRDISTSDAKRAVILQAADKIQKAAQTQTAAGQPAAGQNQGTMDAEQWLKDAKKIISDNTAAYTDLGFTGPAWMKTVPEWWARIPNRNDETYGEYWRYGLWDAGRTILGWLIMTFLLSAGAPFWQDALESLFGIKNLVRKGSETRNVEEKSGAGQPKP
jgi:hypothetical protein